MPDHEPRPSTEAPSDQKAERRRDARAWALAQLSPSAAPTPEHHGDPEGNANHPKPIGTPVVNTDPVGEPWSDLPGPKVPRGPKKGC